MSAEEQKPVEENQDELDQADAAAEQQVEDTMEELGPCCSPSGRSCRT